MRHILLHTCSHTSTASQWRPLQHRQQVGRHKLTTGALLNALYGLCLTWKYLHLYLVCNIYNWLCVESKHIFHISHIVPRRSSVTTHWFSHHQVWFPLVSPFRSKFQEMKRTCHSTGHACSDVISRTRKSLFWDDCCNTTVWVRAWSTPESTAWM